MNIWKGYIKSPLKKLLDPYDLFAPFMLRREGALEEDGWFRSYRVSAPVDRHGEAIPWVTYPFIDFISERLEKEFDIFEFGSGNSTLFYSRHVRSVTSVEHDKAWYETMVANLPANAIMLFKELSADGDYSRSAEATLKPYDIIIVDGRDRVNCCRNCLSALKAGGVVVLDDSERPEYHAGRTFLKNHGFREIPFWGMAPGLLYKKCTTVFYRTDNCLGI